MGCAPKIVPLDLDFPATSPSLRRWNTAVLWPAMAATLPVWRVTSTRTLEMGAGHVAKNGTVATPKRRISKWHPAIFVIQFNSTICVSSFLVVIVLSDNLGKASDHPMFVPGRSSTNNESVTVESLEKEANPSAQNHFPAHFNTIHMVYRCIVLYIYTGVDGDWGQLSTKTIGYLISYRIIYSLPMFLHWIPKAPVAHKIPQCPGIKNARTWKCPAPGTACHVRLVMPCDRYNF